MVNFKLLSVDDCTYDNKTCYKNDVYTQKIDKKILIFIKGIKNFIQNVHLNYLDKISFGKYVYECYDTINDLYLIHSFITFCLSNQKINKHPF